MSGETSEEKNLPPSERTLRKAREKGQVAASKDFVTAAVTIGAIFYIAFLWKYIADKYSNFFDKSVQAFNGSYEREYKSLLDLLMVDLTLILAPLLALIFVLAVLANVFHKGGIPFSFDPVVPKFEKLNPVAGFKKMFGFRAMVELLTALAKLMLWLGVVAILFRLSIGELISSQLCNLNCVLTVGMKLFIEVLIAAVILMILSALLDLPMQVSLFKREKRMTRTQMKQENKENQGNPEIKQKRRELHRELLENADNTKSSSGKPLGPTFVIYGGGMAIALHFDADSPKVPFVVAKGKGDQMNTILQSGSSLGIPLELNADLAGRIYRSAGIGNPIPEDAFSDIVEIIVKHGLA